MSDIGHYVDPDRLTGEQVQAISNWASNEEAQAKFQSQLREFIETKPLYSQFLITLPPARQQFRLDLARLYCPNLSCQKEQPFKPGEHQYWYHYNDRYLGFKELNKKADWLINGTYPLELECQECRNIYSFFIHIDVKNRRVMKYGQMPMWTPRIDNDMAKELGSSYSFYVRALRNLNESYGIGACAYFRRMIEDYINPLLQLLHDYKKEEGARPEELQKILDVKSSKNFSAKTEYAAQICPTALIVQGMNPLKELHEQLSYNIHAGTDKEATEVAIKIQKTVEYVVRSLRKHYVAQKEFIEAMRQNRKE
jgi:hypothetical protein